MDRQKVFVPPLKVQGIKTKLVSHIKKSIEWDNNGIYFEPFMGSGVVGFNIAPNRAIFSDNNPHIIAFYQAIQKGVMTKNSAKSYLQYEGNLLQQHGYEHYLQIRERFNKEQNPFDFLFLNRSCFNGLMRFNSKGAFNVPYCKKDARFSQSYITKIINQIDWVAHLIQNKDYEFKTSDFSQILQHVKQNDFIYCDPPYIDRHADYFNGWDKCQEKKLHDILYTTKSKFILSTWHSNQYRQNEYIKTLWGHFYHETIEHFYHLGASENNRHSIKETLVKNYAAGQNSRKNTHIRQVSLFESMQGAISS